MNAGGPGICPIIAGLPNVLFVVAVGSVQPWIKFKFPANRLFITYIHERNRRSGGDGKSDE